MNAVVARLYATAAGRQALQVDTPSQVRDISIAIFERTFIITRVLNWLAAGVAAIGLLSALLAWQLGRTHELALLRVLGLSRSGAAVMIQAQSIFMGAVAVLAALPAGVLTALLLVRVINRRAFGWEIDLHLHPAQLTSAIAFGARCRGGGRFVPGLAHGARATRPGPAGGVVPVLRRNKSLLAVGLTALLALGLGACQRPASGVAQSSAATTPAPVLQIDRLSVLRAADQPGFAQVIAAAAL